MKRLLEDSAGLVCALSDYTKDSIRANDTPMPEEHAPTVGALIMCVMDNNTGVLRQILHSDKAYSTYAGVLLEIACEYDRPEILSILIRYLISKTTWCRCMERAGRFDYARLRITAMLSECSICNADMIVEVLMDVCSTTVAKTNTFKHVYQAMPRELTQEEACLAIATATEARNMRLVRYLVECFVPED